MKKLLLFLFGFYSFFLYSQEDNFIADTLHKSLFKMEEGSVLENIHFTMDLRLSLHNHHENGRDDNYTEFRNLFAIGLQGKINDKIGFRFRNRYNREAVLQTLDQLDGSVELAYIDVQLSPRTELLFGKMFAFFGGYEYEFIPADVLEYNDIQNNLLNYVTGIGVKHKISENHEFGFQALNSRTMRYQDLYEGNVPENVKEPKWPLALVGNWNGSFFDGKFETIYSFSRFRIAKQHGTTHAITLGNKLHLKKWTLMYDFNISDEQLDTKGIITEILDEDLIALDAVYMEHWLRSEYEFSPSIKGLITLMTSAMLMQRI